MLSKESDNEQPFCNKICIQRGFWTVPFRLFFVPSLTLSRCFSDFIVIGGRCFRQVPISYTFKYKKRERRRKSKNLGTRG